MYASEGSPPRHTHEGATDAWASTKGPGATGAAPAGAKSQMVGGGEDLFMTVRHHVQHNRFKEAEELVEVHPGLVKQTDEKGNTLLAIACQNNKKRFVKLFLRHGADINAKNDAGNTALHFCSSYSYHELGEYLISKQADAGARNCQGKTPVEVKSMRLSGRLDGSPMSVALREAMPSIAETAPGSSRPPPPSGPPSSSMRAPPPQGPPKSVAPSKRPTTTASYRSDGGGMGMMRPPGHGGSFQPAAAVNQHVASSKPSGSDPRPHSTMGRPGPSAPPPQSLKAAPELWNTAVPVYHGDGYGEGHGEATRNMYQKAKAGQGSGQIVKSSQNLKSTVVPVFHADELRYLAEQQGAAGGELPSKLPRPQ